MKIYFYIFSIIFIFGCLRFSIKRKHLLIILLSLEFIVLTIFILIFIFIKNQLFDLYFLMIFLTIRVCEGALGLSILVSLIRTHGNDYFQSFNILW